jgi:hypothetical protein
MAMGLALALPNIRNDAPGAASTERAAEPVERAARRT